MSNDISFLQELLGGVIPGTFTSSQLAAVHRYDPEDEKEEEEEDNRGHQRCPMCWGKGEDEWGDTCAKCGGMGKVTKDNEFIGHDEEEQEAEVDPDTEGDLEPEEGDPVGGEQQPQDGQLPDENLDLKDKVEEPEDPDRAGVIRQVDNAHLVYKRQNEEGSFDELWTYNIGNDINDELQIRKGILAGTDIPPKKTRNEDGSQRYNLTTLGNAQLLKITGLPQ